MGSTEVSSCLIVTYALASHWRPPPYNSPYQNWKRGMYCVSTALFVVSIISSLTDYRLNPSATCTPTCTCSTSTMSGPKHVPNTIFSSRRPSDSPTSGRNYLRSKCFNLPNPCFRMVFSLVMAGGDTAVKLSAWQYIYGSTWSPNDYADWNSYKHLVCAWCAITPTCWTGIPFENAKRAYYADKTWPAELRRNYTSPTNALLRIPVEEGPYYLMRGGLPIATSQWMFWCTYLTLFTWCKNKFFFLWVYNDFNYDYCKAINMGFSFSVASAVAYPCYYIREMVDLWPKERGGHCTWNNSYRQCFKWCIENMDILGYNYLTNYS